MFGESPSATFAVRDVWAGKDMGAFTGSYKVLVLLRVPVCVVVHPLQWVMLVLRVCVCHAQTAVAAHATVYLILTPVA